MEEGKKKRLILCATIGAVVLIAALIIFLLNKDKIKASTMRLLRVVGEVTLEEGKKKKTIIDNLRLADGNALSTGTESLASVGLDDTKIISVEENSRAEFYQKGKKLELNLTKGRLFFDVQVPLADNESLDIKSSTMVVGIRGTSGYVWEDPAKGIQYIYITDGHVKVDGYNPQTGNTEQVTIGPGQRATAYMNDDGTFNTFIVEDVTEEDLPIALIRELFNNEETLERVLKATGYDKNKLIKRLLESDEASYITLEGFDLPDVEAEPEPEPVVEEEVEEPEPEPIVEEEPEPEPVKESVVETKTETPAVVAAPVVVSEPEPEPAPEPEPEPAQQQTSTPEPAPAPTSYSISAASSDPNKGTASVSPSSAVVGDTVTLTATPNTNYEFVRWEVTGGSAALASATSSTTTFTMTDANVSVNAVFQLKPGIIDPNTREVLLSSDGTKAIKNENDNVMTITQVGSNRKINIGALYETSGSSSYLSTVAFEPGVLQSGDVIIYDAFESQDTRASVGIDAAKPIDNEVTVVSTRDDMIAVTSVMSKMQNRISNNGSYATDFTVTTQSGLYTFNYNQTYNRFDYTFDSPAAGQQTVHLTSISSENVQGTAIWKTVLVFEDDQGNQYFLKETDPDGTIIPHNP